MTSTKANLPDFKRLFHGEVSKFVMTFLKKHGFESPERVFGDGRSHHMRLVNSAAQLVYLHYSDVQVVKDGLTRTVDEYPGFVSDPAMMKGTVIRIARPPRSTSTRGRASRTRRCASRCRRCCGVSSARTAWWSTSSGLDETRSGRTPMRGSGRCWAPSA
ncbi:MAG: hypothetical protein SangKO_092580 [Sandaracinaceae bacterium]